MDRRYLFIAALLATADASAAKLNKCVDESGHVTFTQAACPGGLAGESITVQRGGAGMSLGPVGSSAMGYEDGGGRKSFNHCGDLTQVDIAHLIGNNRIQVGMTAEDVEKSWRRPDRINRSSHGNDQWVYDRADYRSQYVYIDGAGCVVAWN